MILIPVLVLVSGRAQTTNGVLSVQVGTGGTPPLALVNHGELWRYRKGTSPPPVGWQTNVDSALDGSWLSGPGGFGYADNDDATVLSDMQNNYTTLYIRKAFEVASGVDTNRHLKLVMDFDDGFVAWLDGAEIARVNAPGAAGSEPVFNAIATAGHEASGGDLASNPNAPTTYDLGAMGTRLQPGTHILAIQGLNAATNSSDLSLIADLSIEGDSSGVSEGVFFALVNTDVVLLTGSNTIPGSVRVAVNGQDAELDSAQGTWSKTQTLAPGFNRLTVQALDSAGATLASTTRDVVVELSSSYVGGTLASNSVWDSSMGIIHVTNSVVVPGGGILSIEPGAVLLLNGGTSILATNASITVNGTSSNTVYFLPADGATVWGGLVAAGTGGNLQVQHAETIAGRVEILEGATGMLEDCYLHDYLVNSPAIVHALRGASLTLRRNHVQRYYEHLIQLTPVVIEDCLCENITGDGIDFDAAPPGSVIRRCTIRHGDIFNVDGLDMGSFTDGTPTRGVVIENCLIYDFTFDKGVSIGEAAQNITVRNCVIYGVQSGIAVKDSSVATISNNTIVDSDYGLHLYQKIAGQGGGHATAYDNIIRGVGTNAVLDSLSTLTISYSDVSGPGTYPGTNNINTDPLFVNPAARDYHLLPGSPCIDAGDPASPSDPDGTRADMGAFPYNSSGAPLPPTITLQPKSQTVAEGRDVTFAVQAGGTPPLAYQWRAGWLHGDIPGATNDTLLITNVQPNAAGNYRVTVSNLAGSVASEIAVLNVITPPTISGTGFDGTNISFTFPSVTNVVYAIEYKDTLNNPAWLILRTVSGNGSPFTLDDPATNSPGRFYRVRVP